MAVLTELNYKSVGEILEGPTNSQPSATGFVENLVLNFGTQTLLQKAKLDLRVSLKFLTSNFLSFGFLKTNRPNFGLEFVV